MGESLLQGITVLDLSRLLPGPMCSMLLADMGADVIKVESTRIGDPLRSVPPMVEGQSCYFLSVNRGKRSLALNLRSREARHILYSLARSCDVFLESFRPGRAEQIGLGYEALKAANPRLVYSSINGFGSHGPLRDRPGHDLGYAARSGLLDALAPASTAPFVPGIPLADVSSALFAALGIVSALLARERGRDGIKVTTGIFQSALALLSFPGALDLAGERGVRQSRQHLVGHHPGYRLYGTSDGRFMAVGALEPVLWADLCTVLGREDLASLNLTDDALWDDAAAELAGVFARRPQQEWTELLDGHEVSCEPVRTVSEALAAVESESGAAVHVEHPSAGALAQIGLPFEVAGSGSGGVRPPPLLGAHSIEILSDLGYDSAEIQSMRRRGVVATHADQRRRRRRTL